MDARIEEAARKLAVSKAYDGTENVSSAYGDYLDDLDFGALAEIFAVNGVKQIPMEGTSLVYSFENAKAKERHTTQYFEIAGNRAIYHDGWYARTIHRAPWEP